MTRQHDQQYGNQHGIPLGRRGNGLGDVSAYVSDVDAAHEEHKQRSSDATPGIAWENPTLVAVIGADTDIAIGLPEIMLAMESLTERQRFVIECRYGLRTGMNGERLAQHEIASLMGITRQAVSLYEQGALKKLRKVLRKFV